MLIRPQSIALTRTAARPGVDSRAERSGPWDGVLALQRLAGNQAVTELLTLQRATGLAEPSAVKRFIKSTGPLVESWDNLGPEQRITQLTEKVNEQLRSVEVPPVNGVLDTSGARVPGGAAAGFSPATWTVFVSGDAAGFVPPGLEALAAAAGGPGSRERASSLASTMLHEARHAEQFFRMARMLIGKGRKVSEVSAALDGMRESTVITAARHPLRAGIFGPSEELKEAEQWHAGLGGYQDIVTALSVGFRDATQTKAAYDEALRRHQFARIDKRSKALAYNAARGAYLTARQRVHAALEAYHAVAHEADAHLIQYQVQKAFGQPPRNVVEKMKAFPEPQPEAVLPPPVWRRAGGEHRTAAPPALLAHPLPPSRHRAAAGLAPSPDPGGQVPSHAWQPPDRNPPRALPPLPSPRPPGTRVGALLSGAVAPALEEETLQMLSVQRHQLPEVLRREASAVGSKAEEELADIGG